MIWGIGKLGMCLGWKINLYKKLKMTKKISFIIAFLLVLSASLDAQVNDSTYFEGEVHFDISNLSLNKMIPKEILDPEAGTKMIGKVKRNKYITYINTSGKKGKTKVIYLLEEAIGYIEYENSDTITKISLEENKDKLLEIKLNKTDKKEILGDSCESISMKFIPDENYGIVSSVHEVHYFNPKYRLDKKLYVTHKVNFWNQFVNLSGSISVRNENIVYPLFKTVMEATQIIEKEISEEEFKLNPSKIVKAEK